MEGYRDDYAAAHEKIEALEHDLAATKRALEEAHARASTQQRRLESLEAGLEQRPARLGGRVLLLAVVSMGLGVLGGYQLGYGSGTRYLKLREAQAASDAIERFHCQ